MKESPLSHKYTEVEDKADRMVKEGTEPGQVMETGDIVQIIARQNYGDNRFRGNLRGYGRQNNRDNYRNERCGSNNR